MSLTDKINMNPPAGSVMGVPLGTAVGMPVIPPMGSPVAKGFITAPKSIKPPGMKGHIKPPSRSVKPKAKKGKKR